MVSLQSEVKAKFEEPGASSRWSDLKVYSAGQILTGGIFILKDVFQTDSVESEK